MKHYLLVWNIAVVVLVIVKCQKYCFVLLGGFYQAVLFLCWIGAIKHHVVFALRSDLVPFNITNQYEFGVFGSINIIPLLQQHWLRFLKHLTLNININSKHLILKYILLQTLQKSINNIDNIKNIKNIDNYQQYQ